MQLYQKKFIDFLVRSKALTFGDFVTKSGRKTPYFINTGNFNNGALITELGSYYASHIVQSDLASADVIFGPAYKGISLAVTTCSALYREHNRNIGFSFNRKEAKDHGDVGTLVGTKLISGMKIVLVEDVITAGTTVREIVPFLRSFGEVIIQGMVIAVDREERGTGVLSAVAEAEKAEGIKVFPIVNINQIVKYLSEPNSSGLVLDAELLERITAYRQQYGVVK